MTVYGDKNNFKVLWYLIPLLIVGSIVGVILMNKITSNIFEEFPLLTRKESINKIVLKSDNYKGTSLIIFQDSVYKSIRAWTLDKQLNNLGQVAEKGDSIAMKVGDNRLYLFKDKSGQIVEFRVQYLE